MTKDAETFLSLVEQHRNIVSKVASAYCRDRTQREDLVQEIVAQLWRSFERYDDRLPFSTWAYRVALNVAISFNRRESRHARHAAPDADARLGSLAAPSEPADGDELHELRGFIARLEEIDRALMILYLEDRPHAEIAAILGLSATNVATKIGRIKHKLRGAVSAAEQTEGRNVWN